MPHTLLSRPVRQGFPPDQVGALRLVLRDQLPGGSAYDDDDRCAVAQVGRCEDEDSVMLSSHIKSAVL